MSALTRDWTVATFVVQEGRVLLLWHRKLSMWLPPGGHINPGELPNEAAVREVREETGIDVVLLSRASMPEMPGPLQLARPEGIQLEDISPGHQHIDLIYFAEPLGPGAVRPVASDEVERVGWYSREDLDSMPLTREVCAWAKRAVSTEDQREA